MLFTVEEFKEHEGLAGTADDALIGALALRISAAVDKYLNRTVEASPTDETDYYDGSGTRDLWLRKPPIITVTSVHVDSSRVWDTGLVEPFVIYRQEGRLTLLPGAGFGSLFGVSAIWPRGTQNVRVIYRGGWAVVPEDIKEGAILWASALFRRRRAAGVISRSIGSFSESYDSGKVPDVAREFLKPYRISPQLTGVSR